MQRHLRPAAAAAIALLATFAHVDTRAQQAPAAAAAAPMGESKAGGLIIKYRDSKRSAVAIAASVQGASAVAAARGIIVQRERENAMGARVLRFEQVLEAAEVEQLARDLKNSDADIEYVEPDYVMQPHWVPNDPRFGDQWHYTDPVGGINLPDALDITDGSSIRVAVLDTGIRAHADLAANILPGYDFITDVPTANDGNGRDSNASDPGNWTTSGMCNPDVVRNSNWHGTHVAGTVAALGNNGIGVSGVAPKAKIVPVRVLGRCGGFTSDIADAIVWAAGGAVVGVPMNANKAQVINMSLGGQQPCSATYQNAINKARNLGAMIVVSAGNANLNISGFQPASCVGVLPVAATNQGGGKATYSNFGAGVFIASPGGDNGEPGVLSTSNTGMTTPLADSYRWMQGTSMAAPHVSGVAALMISANSTLPINMVSTIMKETARSFPGSCSACGAGIVNAAAAVKSAYAYTAENEPNNTTGTQQFLTKNPADVYGAINDGNSDNDHYLVPLAAGSTLTATLDNRGWIDMNLYFYNSNTGQVLGGSAKAGGGGDEKITYVNTSGKLMWITLRVLRGAMAPAAATVQPYKLMVRKS